MAVTTNSAKVTLPGDTQILITREFDAPKHLVWKAYTDPELIRRWWAGSNGTVTVAEVDLRVGGSYRYALATSGDESFEVAFHGEFREVEPTDRLVNTEVYEGAPDGLGVITTTFTEVDGRTTLSQLCDYNSREVRDAVIESGMESGMQSSMDELEKVAAALV